jgi:hypothetical protein
MASLGANPTNFDTLFNQSRHLARASTKACP